jgi:hypothetical protein
LTEAAGPSNQGWRISDDSYAVGHATGGSTVVKSLGKVPMTFSDPQYFRWAPKYDVLNGE